MGFVINHDSSWTSEKEIRNKSTVPSKGLKVSQKRKDKVWELRTQTP